MLALGRQTLFLISPITPKIKMEDIRQPTMEDIEAMEDYQEDQAWDNAQNQIEDNSEWQEAYGAPEPEERQNAHSFLHRATFDSDDTTKTSWLSESELGRPLFSVRFLLDMEDISKFYIDPLAKQLNVENKIADYFLQKIHNTTDSGMSNKGFAMNLNVTRKMDTTRRKMKELPPQLKGKTPA